MTERLRLGAQAALDQAPLWQVATGRDAIVRNLKFPDFSAAMKFMAEVAKTADLLDHHPEWTNVYNRVEVVLTTHSEQTVTDLDVALAHAVDAAAEIFQAS